MSRHKFSLYEMVQQEFNARAGLKYEAVLQARFGVEVVGSLVFGKFITRLEAEKAVEQAENNNAAIERKEVLTKLYPGSIITTHVELIKGM